MAEKLCLVCEKELLHPVLQMHLECHQKAFLALLSRLHIPIRVLMAYIPSASASTPLPAMEPPAPKTPLPRDLWPN